MLLSIDKMSLFFLFALVNIDLGITPIQTYTNLVNGDQE